MKMTVCKEFRFDAAHHLPNYEGKCKNLHGHTWTLEVEVSANPMVRVASFDPVSGMVVDFAKLKDVVNRRVIGFLDHNLLNDVVSNPTAENLLEWMWKNLDAWIKELGCDLSRLRLYETTDSFAELRV